MLGALCQISGEKNRHLLHTYIEVEPHRTGYKYFHSKWLLLCFVALKAQPSLYQMLATLQQWSPYLFLDIDHHY